MIANMARFIQLAPIIFGFAFLRDTRKSNLLYLIMAGVFLVADWMIGIYYRGISIGLTGSWIAWTAVEDFVFFTAGSELLIMFTAGVLWNMIFPLSEFKERIRSLFSETINLFDKTQNRLHNQPVRQTTNFANKNQVQPIMQLRTNVPSERTNSEQRTYERPTLPNEGSSDIRDKIIVYAKDHKTRFGGYPGPSRVAKQLNCSRSYASEVLSTLKG